jgi:hypothetical protein
MQALHQRIGDRLAGLPVAGVARSTSGSDSQCSNSCDGSSTKSRSTCVPDSRSKVTFDSRPCRPWPNSWNSVRASSSDSSVGSPGAPLAKLLLLRITGSSAIAAGELRFCQRSALIHAPLRLPARAKLSCRKMPTTLPVASRTS